MSPTVCPNGTPWCQRHEVLDEVDDDGNTVHRCTRWLFTRYAPVQPRFPSTALYVSDSSSFPDGPGIALQQYENPPQSVTPEQARELAAALVRGAEIVEAARTATCPTCGHAAVPADLLVDEDGAPGGDGDCGACRSRRFGEAVKRRNAMKVIK